MYQYDELHKNLKAGTYLVGINPAGRKIVLAADMCDDFAYVYYVKKDGTRDFRFRGWSCVLPMAMYAVVV